MRMASSSTASGSRGNQLRFIDCPSCGVPVVKIRSKQKETYGQFFFKCPNNIKGDPSTCGFIRSEQQYEFYVRGLERNQNDELEWAGDGNEVLRWQCAELMQATGMLKQQVDMALTEIRSLKNEISAMKENKETFVMHVAVAVTRCVGVLIGLFVRAMWK
ncbi:unnamed protein product [Urochloa humidicola]